MVAVVQLQTMVLPVEPIRLWEFRETKYQKFCPNRNFRVDKTYFEWAELAVLVIEPQR